MNEPIDQYCQSCFNAAEELLDLLNDRLAMSGDKAIFTLVSAIASVLAGAPPEYAREMQQTVIDQLPGIVERYKRDRRGDRHAPANALRH